MPPISALRQLRSGQSHPTSCVFAVDEVRFAALCPPSRRPARCTLPADCSRALTLLRVSPPPVFSRGNPPDDLSLASYRCWDGRRWGSSEEESGEEENVLLSFGQVYPSVFVSRGCCGSSGCSGCSGVRERDREGVAEEAAEHGGTLRVSAGCAPPRWLRKRPSP